MEELQNVGIDNPGFELKEKIERMNSVSVSKSHKSFAHKLLCNLRKVSKRKVSKVIFLIAYLVFFVIALTFHLLKESHFNYCNDVGLLIIINAVVFFYWLYQVILRKKIEVLWKKYTKWSSKYTWIQNSGYMIAFLLILIFIIVDSLNQPRKWISVLGLGLFLLLGLAISKCPRKVHWKTLAWGIGMQFLFGFIVLRTNTGENVVGCLANKISTFLDFTNVGSEFVFGYLVHKKPFLLKESNFSTSSFETLKSDLNNSMSFVFMFKVLSVIYFFSFCVSMLFYLGTINWIVTKIGWILQTTMGTTPAESMNAAANIFLGQSETILLIHPYISSMTNSELHAVMTGGFATIAGSVLAAYINFGIPAKYLISASVMSAPAALAYAKLAYPEDAVSQESVTEFEQSLHQEESNILDAASRGASNAVFLVLNIAASLIAFLAFIAFCNSVLAWMGSLVGIWNLSFELLLGYLFCPFAWLMGVDDKDIIEAGKLLGLKTFVNEFVAYEKLSRFSHFSERSRAVITFALCGFSNPASIGIQLAVIGTMVPSRKGDLALVAFRACFSGTMACFLTACVAGILVI